MEWSGGFTELPIDPVLEKNMPLHVQFQSWRAFFFFLAASTSPFN